MYMTFIIFKYSAKCYKYRDELDPVFFLELKGQSSKTGIHLSIIAH